MTSREPTGERPNNTLFDAYAITKRLIDEAQWAQRFANLLNREPYQKPPEAVLGLVALAGAYQLVETIEGLPARSSRQYFTDVAQVLNDEIFAELILNASEDIEDVDADELRALCLGFGEGSMEFTAHGREKSVSSENSLFLYRKALDLAAAKDNSVTIEDIFKDDGLFVELVHFAYTPVEMAKIQIKALRSITVDSIEEFMISSQIAAKAAEAEKHGFTLSEDEIEEIKDQVNDPEFLPRVTEQYLQEVTIQSIVFQAMLERYWGVGTVINLPPDVQQALKSPLKDSTI